MLEGGSDQVIGWARGMTSDFFSEYGGIFAAVVAASDPCPYPILHFFIQIEIAVLRSIKN